MIIFHIDVNNAFLSWESVYRLREEGETLDLRTVAAVIGGSEKTRHGIVLAKSPIAKTYGIKTAETLSDAGKNARTFWSFLPATTFIVTSRTD